MVSQNNHCLAVWLNLPLSRRPFPLSVVRGRGGWRTGSTRPLPSRTFNGARGPGIPDPEGAGALPRSQRCSPGLQAKPGPSPPRSRCAPGGTFLPGARPNERTASSAGKARSGSRTALTAQRRPAAGGRAGRQDLGPAAASPTRDGARGNGGVHCGGRTASARPRARRRGGESSTAAPEGRAGGLLRPSFVLPLTPRAGRGSPELSSRPLPVLTHRRGRQAPRPVAARLQAGELASPRATEPAQAQTLTDPSSGRSVTRSMLPSPVT